MSPTIIGQRRPTHSPATRRGFHNGRRWPAEILTPDDVYTLMVGCSKSSATGLRNRAIIATLYRAGLRIAECLDLYPKDVDHDAGSVMVLCGKGGKRRTVGIDQGALEHIGLWEARRRALLLDGSVPLFSSLHGTRLYSSYVQATLKRLAREAGIEKRIHPHALRHTHAYELAMEGAPMPIIQRQLGHSNLGTTSRYLDHIAPADVIEHIAAREWAR